MPLSKLAFKPGINREGTNYSNEGGWHDGDKIRFRYGYVEKMRGWEKVNPEAYVGTPRAMHDFVTLNSESLLFIGSEKKAYVEESGSLYDITPYRRTVALPYDVTGVEATTNVGTVQVPIGGSVFDNIAIPKGVQASGTAGRVASVSTQQNQPFGFQAFGRVGVVRVNTTPLDVTVGGIEGLTVGLIVDVELTGAVGTVTVDAEVVEE